jgi:putative molybdopterin biosynthesis protein
MEWMKQSEGCRMMNDLLTAQEAADYLKVKKTTVYEMIKRGELPSVRIGKQLRITRVALEEIFAVEQPPQWTEQRPITAAPGIYGNVILCGQDASLDLIANQVSARMPDVPILRSYTGSYNSLYLLYQGKVSIATDHLWDEKSESYNLPYIEKLLPGLAVTVVRLFGRMTGIYVQPGNPKQIHAMKDLCRRDVTMINREKGSGTRILLDEKLKAAGISGGGINGYSNEQSSHITIAGAVARGEADVGLGTENAVRQVEGVEFIPLQKEWYDMVFLTEREQDAVLQAILEFIHSNQFIKDLTQMGDYDFSQTGRRFTL